MTFGQPTMVRHTFPWGLELVAAAVLGAALLFSGLVAIGHTDLLPWTTTEQPAAGWMNPAFQNFREGERAPTSWMNPAFQEFRQGEIGIR